MKEKLTKEWVGLLCILEMTLPIKFETICVFLSITIRLLTESMENIIVPFCYKPPGGNSKNHCDHLQEIPTNTAMENKLSFDTGDFNLNCFRQSFKIRQFFNNMFEKEAIL